MLSQSGVARLTKDLGIPIPQGTLSEWISKGLLRTEHAPENGKPMSLTPGEAMRAITIRQLRKNGASYDAVRRAVRKLEDYHDIGDWQAQYLFVDPHGEVGWYDSEKDLVARLADGQGYVIELGDVRARLEQEAREPEKEKARVGT